jgi:peptidoglycan hydrolase CwlO-like protein
VIQLKSNIEGLESQISNLKEELEEKEEKLG